MADVPKPTADPMRAQRPRRIWRPLPRTAKVAGQRDGQAKLGIGGKDQPGPAVSLLGVRTLAAVHPKVPLANRMVCSMV
jgi:hypothetical protein